MRLMGLWSARAGTARPRCPQARVPRGQARVPGGRGGSDTEPSGAGPTLERGAQARGGAAPDARRVRRAALPRARPAGVQARAVRSEEHTSELQSRQYLVCRLLLEKKKNNEY